jgi:hypothetical protein
MEPRGSAELEQEVALDQPAFFVVIGASDHTRIGH